jgi:[protein-PII] uridylyltransferase
MSERMAVARRIWKEEWTNNSFCLCVSGSVARQEETEFSDIDLLVILGSADAGDAIVSERVVSALTTGIEHASVAVRSLSDISSMIETDIRSWVAQMDAVFLEGDTSVYLAFRESVRSAVMEKRTAIIEAIEHLTEGRHEQYGTAVTLLEPNIKNSAGTLRDIHTIYYMGLLDVIAATPVSSDPWPQVREVLFMMALLEQRKRALCSAYDFFLSVRTRMHALSGHLHDSLDFELQWPVSEALGFTASESRKGVEHFMRAYYTHAREVHKAVRLVFYDQKMRDGTGETKRDSMLHLPDNAEKLDDLVVMRMFLDMAHNGLTPSGEVIRALDQLRGMKFGATAVRLFNDILKEPAHVADTLMFMHEQGMLAAVLQEFSALEHYFQHNVYHFFTADEHTLRAIRAAESSMRENEHCAAVLSQIEDKSVLYYALLLHDIAKPIDLPRHEHVGADLVPDILRRFGRMDIIETVSFLVREHLRMEQLAFRRNIREITTLQPFLDIVRDVERLNLLYLLTLADMSALNPGVLTDWKKELLRELYETTRKVLLTGELEQDQRRQQIDEPRSVMNSAEYSAAVQDVIDGELVRIHLQHHRAYSEVTVFCLDRPQLLSQFSAALFGADCSIVDASIETRHDVVIDNFRVVDIFTGSHLRSDQSHMLRQLIRSVCAGELDAELLFDQYRRKWVRKLRKLPKKHVTVDVAYIPHVTGEGQEQTIVEVYAPDTFGLLYRLSAELSSFGLNVVFAKIATRIDGVVDSFYVLDSQGRAFTDVEQRQELRQRLLERITKLTQ